MVLKSKLGLHKEKIQINITEEEVLKRIEQIESLDIDDDLRKFMTDALKALVSLDIIIGMKNTTIARLRRIFDKKIEKSDDGDSNNDDDLKEGNRHHPRGNNRGRNGRKQYPNAPIIKHAHEKHKKGDICPDCRTGKLGDYDSGIYIRITGTAPLQAIVHETEKLRCNGCLKIFEASFEGKDAPKYDVRAKAIVAILKYKASMPFHRLEKIQKQLLIPMPASTQWDLMEALANDIAPMWKYFLKIAPDADIFYQDDTKGKVQTLMAENKKHKQKVQKGLAQKKDLRQGIYTSGIVAEFSGELKRKLVLYFTGRKYSGENLENLLNVRLAKQEEDVVPPMVMSDALPTNKIDSKKIVELLCLAHGRRQFFDLGKKFEQESNYVIDQIKVVYKAEAEAKNGLSAEGRLLYLQKIVHLRMH
jgi:hypothetical protein